jgi:hypothetical protein
VATPEKPIALPEDLLDELAQSALSSSEEDGTSLLANFLPSCFYSQPPRGLFTPTMTMTADTTAVKEPLPENIVPLGRQQGWGRLVSSGR